MTKRVFYWLIGVIMLLGLSSCDLNYPHRFTHGKIVPNARVLIELPEPRTFAELYPDFIEAASRGGFVHSIGYTGSLPLEERLEGPIGHLIWVENPDNKSAFQRGVEFLSKFNGGEEPDPSKRVATSITFKFRRENVGSFTKEEWLEFFVFYEEILPAVFPDADIRISEARHPAVFTDDEVLKQILEETDIEIPENYLPTSEEGRPKLVH